MSLSVRFFFYVLRRPPISTLPCTLFPYTPLFRSIDSVRRYAPSFRFRYRLGDVVRARLLVEPRQRVENPGAHRGPLLARAFERRLRGLRQRGAVMLMMIVPRHERNLGCRGVRGKSDGSGPAPLLKSPFCDFSNGLSAHRAAIEIGPKRKPTDADDAHQSGKT